MMKTVLRSILLDLRKAYDALDRDHCLGILAGYGVGPRTLRILRTYWAWIHMEAKVGGGNRRHPQYIIVILEEVN